uniref:Dilute domain-containing protein n=1 Tax=Plectus sambesii TaxID=2011161 RepID=A0A914X592_9BILA
MTLQNRIDRQTNELMEARAQLRGYSGVGNLTLESTTDSEIVRLESLRKEDVEHSALLEVFNVPEFCRILVCDLKPRLARLLTPCLPSYLMLTGFRFQDHAKDEAGLTGLFNTLHVALKDTVARSHDLDVLAMWLVNSWRLLNLLRQYSGENQTEWGAGNTEKQKGHCIQNFDLAPFREKLRARVEECYQNFMKRAVEPVLSPKIVPGILQHESSQELQLTASTTTNGAGQNGLSRQSSKDHVSLRALDDLIALLGFVHSKLGVFGADPVLLGQVFGQITSWTCALALNHLMFRKELCNFEKAIQIKHNVTEIQSWLHEKGLGEFRETLEPLVQASHLLQSKKDESNLDTLTGEMTSKLKPKQIIALLQHYAPSDGFEERRLPAEFLAKVSERLATERSNIDEESPIMMGTYLTPFDTTPFIHSDYRLESISLPTCLHLQNVARLL